MCDSTHLTVGVITECLVCFIKHYTADFVGGARPLSEVILDDLRREEKHMLTLPQTDTLFGR